MKVWVGEDLCWEVFVKKVRLSFEFEMTLMVTGESGDD